MNNAMTVVEPVLAKCNAIHLKGKLRAFPGRVELTSKSIVFYQRSRIWLAFGALGMLLGQLTAGKRALDLELGRIASTTRTKYGFNKNILDVTMTDGTTYRLGIARYDDFTARLNEQLARRAS
jgi:hypothetical protein